KLLILLMTLIILTGCSSFKEGVKDGVEDHLSIQEDEEVIGDAEEDVEEEIEETEPTQEELDKEVKEDAIEAEFAEINGDRVAIDTRLTATGEVSIVMREGALGEFDLTT